MRKFKLVDLFAGAGGLSLGFQRTGRFEIVAAVEKNEAARETYHYNFANTEIYEDIRDIDFSDFNEKYGGIDVVIGGPPCQGFSNANRQHNQTINLNNKLVKQYIRAILEIQPKAFVMENVSMLKSDVHRFYIERTDFNTINRYNIDCKEDYILLAKSGEVFDDLQEILSDEKALADNCWDPELFHIMNILYKARNNQQKLNKAYHSYYQKIKKLTASMNYSGNKYIISLDKPLFEFFDSRKSDLCPLLSLLSKPISYQKMFNRMCEIYNNGIDYQLDHDDKNNLRARVRSCAVYEYLTKILGSEENGYAINNGILSAIDFGIPQKRKRFIIMGVKKKYTDCVELPHPKKNTVKTNVHDAIFDLQKVPIRFDAKDDDNGPVNISDETLGKVTNLKSLRDTGGKIYNHIIPRTKEAAMERFKALKQGENFHSLSDELKENTYTQAARTQNTVYCRLTYSKPSGTVINVRKSMWIHPELDRAVSVREAARLQTFPDSFRICGTKDSQYQQVGNAVPPMLAEAIAEQILNYLK